MDKIMLVVDDYGDLVALESLLKRVGFDVLALNKESAVADALLGFFPSVVISTLKSRVIDGLRVAGRVRKSGGTTRIVMLVPRKQMNGIGEDVKARVDAFVESPIDPSLVLDVVARLLQQDPLVLLEKYTRLNLGAGNDDDGLRILKNKSDRDAATRLAGNNPAENATVRVNEPSKTTSEGYGGTLGAAARAKRYEEFLVAIVEPVDNVVSHVALARATAQLKDVAKSDRAELERIDEQKREFVRAMMKKAKQA